MMRRKKTNTLQKPINIAKILAIVAFSALGAALLVSALAGTIASSFESENSSTSGPARLINDPGASNQQAIQFASAPIQDTTCLDRSGANVIETNSANGFVSDPDWDTEYIYKNNGVSGGTVFNATNSNFLYSLINDTDTSQLYSIALRGGQNVCWTGGRVVGTVDDNDVTEWELWHDLNGFRIGGMLDFTMENLYIRNFGDLINISDDSNKNDAISNGFTIKDSLLRHSHDDCVQNDKLASGKIVDSFLDGCYTGISARMSSSDASAGIIDGSSNLYEIENSLLWMEPMTAVYKGPIPGHGGFLKWENDYPERGIKLSLKNVTLMAKMDPRDKIGNEAGSNLVTCENVTVVWLGSGSYPGYDWPPGCVTVLTGSEGEQFWLQKVDEWYTAHPQFNDIRQPDSYYFN